MCISMLKTKADNLLNLQDTVIKYKTIANLLFSSIHVVGTERFQTYYSDLYMSWEQRPCICFKRHRQIFMIHFNDALTCTVRQWICFQTAAGRSYHRAISSFWTAAFETTSQQCLCAQCNQISPQISVKIHPRSKTPANCRSWMFCSFTTSTHSSNLLATQKDSIASKFSVLTYCSRP